MNNPQPTDAQKILLFTLDEPRYALNLSAVERVVRSVEIIPLPKAPQCVLGVINVQGEIIPVVDIRPRLGLPRREVSLGNQFILAHTSRQRVALVADSVTGIRQLAEGEMVTTDQALPGAQYIHGLAKLDEGIVLICDLDQFLVFDDELKLEAVLEAEKTKPARKTRRKAKQVV
jgi:purine-binding chemotaxis protein CheW